MIWRLVSFLDRLFYCQHDRSLLERGDDGSLWRSCPDCGTRIQLLHKSNVVPLHHPSAHAPIRKREA